MVKESIPAKQNSKSAPDLHTTALRGGTLRDQTNVHSVHQPPGSDTQDDPEELTKPKGKSVLGRMVLTASHEDSVNIKLPS